MSHLRNRFLEIFVVVTAALISGQASATEYVTQAWAQSLNMPTPTSGIDRPQQIAAIDGVGNVYVLEELFGNGSATSGAHTLSLVALTPDRQILTNKAVLNGDAIPRFIQVVNGSNNQASAIYFEYEITVNNLNAMVVGQCTPQGVISWSKQITDSAGITPCGLGVDSSGNVYVAAFKNAPEASLVMYVYTPAGVLSRTTADPNMEPQTALFYNDQWLMTGVDRKTENGARFSFYDTLGNVLYTQTAPYTTGNASYVTSYVLSPGSNGTVYVSLNTTQVGPTSLVLSESHVLENMDTNGQLNWKSSPRPGYVAWQAYDAVNGKFYDVEESLLSNGTEQTFVKQFNTAGAGIWSKAGPVKEEIVNAISLPLDLAFFEDKDGVYLFAYPAPSFNLEAFRWDSSGNLVLSQPLAFSTYTGAADQNGTLYLNSVYAYSSNYDLNDVYRYVEGITLSSITTTTPSINGNSTLSVKVSLNAPAPNGGFVVNMKSTSGYALFSNMTQSYVLNIPTGTQYVTLQLKVSAVPSYEHLDIEGDLNGVQRSVAITVIPS